MILFKTTQESVMHNNDKWATVRAFEMGYRVQEDGSVLSPQGIVRKPWEDKLGYLSFMIRIDGHSTNISVHKLAAYQRYGEAYLAKEIVARHKDENPGNCRPNNILIGTQHDNMMDRDPEARQRHACIAAAAKRHLSDVEKEELIEDRKSGMTYKQLSRKYGLAKSSISYLLHNKTYKTPSSSLV